MNEEELRLVYKSVVLCLRFLIAKYSLLWFSVFLVFDNSCLYTVVRTMSMRLHPAIATLAGVILVLSYLYAGYWIVSLTNEGVFDVPSVLASLLEAEAAAKPRRGATVAVAFGGCRDRLASSADVLHQLGASCPNSVSNVNELHDMADLEKTFAYYFKNGASAGSVHVSLLFMSDTDK